jgi:ABC-type lipoprotein release transport system permease subunit
MLSSLSQDVPLPAPEPNELLTWSQFTIARAQSIGISPLDPIAFVASALFMLIVATMATVLPARKALKVDPVTALRHD